MKTDRFGKWNHNEQKCKKEKESKEKDDSI